MKLFSRKALNEQKEMKLLLDMYKGVSKEQRDKVQLMASEKKLRTEIEDLRQQMKKIQVGFNLTKIKSYGEVLSWKYFRKVNARIEKN